MYPLANFRILLFLGGLIMLFSLPGCQSVSSNNDNLNLKPLTIPGLENFYQYSEQVYGGSGPYTQSDFAKLKELGVDLVVSVDGAIPKVELAEAAGLKYAHIPIGYDGVPREAQVRLVKAFEMADSVYVHCHHGKHRGPAAIASILVGVGEITSNEAVNMLKVVGTSDKYMGLYRDVQNAKHVSDTELATVEPLPAVADVSDFTRSMVAIDLHWERLKITRRSGWKVTEEHPDVEPAHEALMLNEQFRELHRQDMEAVYSEKELKELREFRKHLKDSVEQSAKLESGLQKGESIELLEHTFRRLEQSCLDCHEAYRNEANENLPH